MRLFKVLFALVVLAAVAVPNAMAFRLEDSARLTPTGVTGQPYNHALPTSAGCKGVYMFVLRGSLPPGIQLVGDKRDDVDGSNWRFVGTPTTPGEWTFELELRNLCPIDSVQETLTIRVAQGLAIQGPGLPVGTQNVKYPDTQLSASGGGTQTWSIASGGLPAGLALSASGLVSGTPTEATQSKPVGIRVSDTSGRSTVRNYEVSIRAPLGITPLAPPAISQIDTPFKWGPLVPTGGAGPYTFALASGTLPTGVNLTPTGSLEGTPTVAGTFQAVIRTTDAEGRTVDTPVTIRVASPVSITSRRFAPLKAGRFYNLAIKTSGGVPIVRFGRDTMNWKVVAGKLPLGLRLNTRVGKLIGTPRRPGTYRFTVEVTDKFRSVDEQSFVLVVKK